MNLHPSKLPALLAERGWIEVVGALIFILFWIFSAIAGTLAKKKQEQEQQQQEAEFERMTRERGLGEVPPTPPPLPPAERPPVTTRDEMERRMAEARERREAAARAEARRRADEARRRADEAARAEQRRREETARIEAQVFRPTAPVEQVQRQQENVFGEKQQARDRQHRRPDRPRVKPGVKPPALPSAAGSPQPLATQLQPETGVRRNVATDDFVYNAASPSAGQRPAVADAATIRKWLNPATLRQQYILTELFQPPLALREDRPVGW